MHVNVRLRRKNGSLAGHRRYLQLRYGWNAGWSSCLPAPPALEHSACRDVESVTGRRPFDFARYESHVGKKGTFLQLVDLSRNIQVVSNGIHRFREVQPIHQHELVFILM